MLYGIAVRPFPWAEPGEAGDLRLQRRLGRAAGPGRAGMSEEAAAAATARAADTRSPGGGGGGGGRRAAPREAPVGA